MVDQSLPLPLLGAEGSRLAEQGPRMRGTRRGVRSPHISPSTRHRASRFRHREPGALEHPHHRVHRQAVVIRSPAMRKAFNAAGTTPGGVAGGRVQECCAHLLSPVRRRDEEAGDQPNIAFRLLVEEAPILWPRADGAPAGRCAVDVRDQAGNRALVHERLQAILIDVAKLEEIPARTWPHAPAAAHRLGRGEEVGEIRPAIRRQGRNGD